MNLEKINNWNNIIETHKYDMTFMYIYYNLMCNEHLQLKSHRLTEHIIKQLEKLIYIIHDAYLKDEQHIDLGYLCDIAVENKDKILNNEDFTKWDLLWCASSKL